MRQVRAFITRPDFPYLFGKLPPDKRDSKVLSNIPLGRQYGGQSASIALSSPMDLPTVDYITYYYTELYFSVGIRAHFPTTTYNSRVY